MARRNVEQIPCFHFNHVAIVHGGRGPAGDDQPHMLHHAALGLLADVDRPSPTRLVGRPPIVIPPSRINSNLPFSNVRTSSGVSNRFRITSYIVFSTEERPQ